MRRPAALLLLLAGCGGGGGAREYGHNDLMLGTAYTAKEACSCLFVIEQPEEFCRAWTKASPDVTKFKIDRAGKRVLTAAGVLWGASARFVSDRQGCVLE